MEQVHLLVGFSGVRRPGYCHPERSEGSAVRALITRQTLAFVLLAAACRPVAAPPRTATETGAVRRARVALSQALPPLDGARLHTRVIEVTYRPGESSEAHSHPCAVMGYVTEGKLRMRVQSQPDTVYGAGDTFYESPGSVHLVSANASTTERARFVVFVLCEGDQPVSVPLSKP
jgi:quercetin dioxygenase-like cupin family protein